VRGVAGQHLVRAVEHVITSAKLDASVNRLVELLESNDSGVALKALGTPDVFRPAVVISALIGCLEGVGD